MTKFELFHKKHLVIINISCILFWSWLIYENVNKLSNGEISTWEKVTFFMPFIFILISIFNIYKNLKEKRS
jgi:hypothetical protein